MNANLRRPVDRFKAIIRQGASSEDQLKTALALFGQLLDASRPNVVGDRTVQAAIEREPDAEVRLTMRYMVDRVLFTRDVLGFEPGSGLQEGALGTWSRRIIFLCNRQWGKSTIAAIRALHRAWFWPGSLILLVSRAHPQSGELLEKIKPFLANLGVPPEKTRGDGVNRKSIKFANGSRIVALPGGQKPGRSYSSVAMVIVDEAAMVPDPVHDAVAPTLARTNGELLLSSTPMGKRGAYYRIWTFGGDGWFRVFGPVTETPRISKEWLAAELERAGDDFMEQEYGCIFLDRDSHLFGEDSLKPVFSQDLESWEGMV